MNPIVRKLEENRKDFMEWFEHLHRHPELSMEEHETARYIADLLRQWGYTVETGVGKPGIVASLQAGDSDKVIGLRAGFDALPIQETNNLPYKSRRDGVAHWPFGISDKTYQRLA